MGIFKVKKIKRALRHYMSMKAARKKLGLTGKSRRLRQLKRGFRNIWTYDNSPLAYDQPTSASSVYQYSGRSISQLMGGV